MKEFIRVWTFATASFLSVFSTSSQGAPYPYPQGVPTGSGPSPLPSPSENPYGVLPPNSASLYPPPSLVLGSPQGPLPGQLPGGRFRRSLYGNTPSSQVPFCPFAGLDGSDGLDEPDGMDEPNVLYDSLNSLYPPQSPPPFPPLSPLPPLPNIRPLSGRFPPSSRRFPPSSRRFPPSSGRFPSSSRRFPQGNGMPFSRGSLSPMGYSPEIYSTKKDFIPESFVREEVVTTIISPENRMDATMNETVSLRFQDAVTKMEESDVITPEEKDILQSVMAELQTQTNLNGDNETEELTTISKDNENNEKANTSAGLMRKEKEEKNEEEKKEKEKEKEKEEEIIGKSAEDEANEEAYDNYTMTDLLAALPSQFSNHYGALSLVSMGVAVSGVILFVGMMVVRRRRTATTVVDNPEAYGPLM